MSQPDSSNLPDQRQGLPDRRQHRRGRDVARWMFHLHLWLGVASTVIVILLSVTGILLNHKRALGLMPDVTNQATGLLADALPMGRLAEIAAQAVGPAASKDGIDRMDVRPRDGLIKVRFRDPAVLEATLDIHSGKVLHVGERNDVFLEKLHSAEIFGSGWVLATDAAAVMLAVLSVSGIWLWLYPRSRR